jgi:predicted Zn-dependent protease
LPGAVHALQRAVRLEPQFTRVWYNLALAYNAMQQHERAIDAMRRTVRLEPGNADYWFALATVLRDAGRIAEARQAADECLLRDGEHVQARALLQVLESP